MTPRLGSADHLIEVPRYSDVATFMRAPRIDDPTDVDIALVGVPYQLGSSVRLGSYAGPASVREQCRNIRGHNVATEVTPLALANVADMGDAPHNPLNRDESFRQIAEFFTSLREHGARWIACGGDHSITVPSLRGRFDGTSLALIHFDAHPDTWGKLYGEEVSTGSAIRLAFEEGIVDPNRTVMVGLRGTLFEAGDRQNTEAMGVRCITYDEFEEIGRAAVISEILKVIGDHPTYITFDMDVLDPVFAPATTGPEPGGLTMRDAQVILRALSHSNIVSADVVEIIPAHDPAAMTAMNAAQVMFEILCFLAVQVNQEKGGDGG
jgi:guanidinopropionase